MNIQEIAQQPTVYEKIHESIFRSYHLLRMVKEMLKRGDSTETIIQIIHHIESTPSTTPENTPTP